MASMNRLLAIILIVLGMTSTSVNARDAVDLELVLAADGSGSIDDDELKLQRDGYAAAITHPRILEAITRGYRQAIALTFVEWGGPDSQHTIVDWMKITDANSARRFAAKLLAAPRAAVGYNSISEAIAFGADKIATNNFDGQRKIIDISGDGPQIGGRSLIEAHALARAQKITVNALVIKSHGGGYPGPRGEPLDEHYKNDVITGRGAFVVVADGRRGFAKAILRKLILEIAEDGNGDVSGL